MLYVFNGLHTYVCMYITYNANLQLKITKSNKTNKKNKKNKKNLKQYVTVLIVT